MTAPPTGTLAFLFTDIEGCTRLWEEYPEQVPPALARHDALLRDAIESNGGTVFKTVGDAFCAVFPTAEAALRAAIAAQQALQDCGMRNSDCGLSGLRTARTHAERGYPAPDTEHQTPSPIPQAEFHIPQLRVRMAVHSGMVEQRDGDYFGAPLNRVARMLAAGHGDQTLVSLAAHDEAQATLPPGVALRSLGERRLKGLPQAEPIFQLVVPGLPNLFPPLDTLDARPTNLPASPGPLVGREEEAAQVCALLRRSGVRLVTLTGAGGVGKSRLALQAASELLEEMDDGVCFVPLAAVTDPALVPAAIAAALEVNETPGRTLGEALKEHLRQKQLLLVLDRFEHLLAAAPLVTDLLRAAPRIRTLVTSREWLQVSGEYEVVIGQREGE